MIIQVGGYMIPISKLFEETQPFIANTEGTPRKKLYKQYAGFPIIYGPDYQADTQPGKATGPSREGKEYNKSISIFPQRKI